jgi:hypothetical protein
MELKLSNIWTDAGTTVTALIAILGGMAPLVVNQTMPTTGAGWATEAAMLMLAIVKALSKTGP